MGVPVKKTQCTFRVCRKHANRSNAAQSAMEYLMTYGWAILIIAVALAALFELGTFNGSNLGPTACIAQAGFVCKNPIYTASDITFTFGQATNKYYYGNWIFVASQGEALNSSGVPVNFAGSPPPHAVQVGFGTNFALVSGQLTNVVFPSSDFQYGAIPSNPPVGTPFAGYVWLGYCTGPCSSPTAYAKVATLVVRAAGAGSFSSGCPVVDPTIYSGSCDVVYTSGSTALAGAIVTTGNITIDSGATVVSNGEAFLSGGAFTNNGVVDTGSAPVDTNFPNSYGGSGGGAHNGGGGSASNGFSTLAVGGSACSRSRCVGTPGSTPTLTQSIVANNMAAWLASGVWQYLSGASGGGGNTGSSGGNGAYGLYVQADSIVPGTINAYGGCGAGGFGQGKSGGGGGGAVVLAYGTGTLGSTGGVNNDGGIYCGGAGSGSSGGAGGAGATTFFSYGSSPPASVSSPPTPPAPINTVLNPGSYSGSENVEFTSSTQLSGDIVTTGNILIDLGATVTSNGRSFIAGGTFTNNGIIDTGPSSQINYPDSYGGSGGGAHDGGGGIGRTGANSGLSTMAAGGSGCNTSKCVAGGGGSTALSQSTVESSAVSWFSNGVQLYLAGAHGGSITGGSPGGAGAYGIYIQANSIIPGTINAYGSNGPQGAGRGKSGGGGGGAVVLAYGTGTLGSTGGVNNDGGLSFSCCGSGLGGAGGPGALTYFSFGTNPPISPSSPPTPSVTINSVVNPASYSGHSNVVFTSSSQLTGDIVTTGNILVYNGVTVTSDGYAFIAGGTFTNNGVIDTGSPVSGTNLPNSYGGSGGGAHFGSDRGSLSGNAIAGFSTMVSGGAASNNNNCGAGCTRSGGNGGSMVLSASTVQSNAATWIANGIPQYLEGGFGGSVTTGEAGGTGAYGVYIQATSIMPGIINAYGGCGIMNFRDGKSGGGGGGAVVLAYGTGTLGSTGGVNNDGGIFCGYSGGRGFNGGSGGNGATQYFSYGSNPPVTP